MAAPKYKSPLPAKFSTKAMHHLRLGDFDLFLSGNEGPIRIIATAGVGENLGGIERQDLEFRSSERHGKTLFLKDRSRSWGNSGDFGRLLEWMAASIEEDTPDKPLFIGNSMGGFYSFLLASALGRGRVLAFSPQWSVSPKVVPEEERWHKFRRKLDFSVESLSRFMSSDYCSLAIFGDTDLERLHSTFFQNSLQKGCVLEIAGTGHNVASVLKTSGALQAIVTEMVRPGRAPDLGSVLDAIQASKHTVRVLAANH